MGSRMPRLRGSAGRISAGIFRFTNFYGSKGARMFCTRKSPNSDESPSRISPWLMLPPSFEEEGGNMVYNFYSLKNNEVLSFNKRSSGGEESELPDDDAKFVGSSHGWLALFNQRNNDLFLSNPLSGQHIKLPPIHTLPDPEINLRNGRGSVSKVIISCSPDEEEECRAMMTFGPGDRLAFCSPRLSTEWTPIGDLFFHKYEEADIMYGRAYEDFAYCSRRKLFSCITEFEIDFEDLCPGFRSELDDWDLRDPHSPRARICPWMRLLRIEGENCPWLKDNMELLELCMQIPYVVFAEQDDQLYVVIRFVMQPIGPDVTKVLCDPVSGRPIDNCSYKTIGFSVVKVDYQNGVVKKLRLVEGGSLGGLAMFIGMNHSFAVKPSAFEFPELKPNSIYFTDANKHPTRPSSVYGGHDIGIFNYENKTLSPCYYPHDAQRFKRIEPPPMWFTPSRHEV